MIGPKLKDILKNARNVCRNVLKVACRRAISKMQTRTKSATAPKLIRFKYKAFAPSAGNNSVILGRYLTEKIWYP